MSELMESDVNLVGCTAFTVSVLVLVCSCGTGDTVSTVLIPRLQVVGLNQFKAISNVQWPVLRQDSRHASILDVGLKSGLSQPRF